MLLSKEVIDGLSPGVRDLVVYLNNELEYPTTDSGDGSNHAAGMECAPPFPMVAMDVSDRDQVIAAKRLESWLYLEGVRFRPTDDDGPRIEVNYSPHDDISILLLINVTSDMVPACLGAAERGLRVVAAAEQAGRGGSILSLIHI